MWSLSKMLAVFLLLLVLLWRRVRVGYALLGCALAVGLVFWLPPASILKGFVEGIFSYNTLLFMALLLTVNVFGRVLKEVEALDRMNLAVETLVGDVRALMAFVPAFIGLLPMPGGALLSAQMVNDAGNRLGLSAERKMVLNYWFRHVWEPVFPMYPGVVLVATLFKIPLGKLIWTFMPITVSSILVGFLFYFRNLPTSEGRASAGGREIKNPVRTLLSGTWPVVVIVMVCLSLRFFQSGQESSGLEPLVVSLALMVGLILLIHRLHPRILWRELRTEQTLELVSLTVGIMVFQQLVDRTGAARSVSDFMDAANMPVPVIVFFVPFLAGLMTGNTSAFVAMTFVLLGGYLYPGSMSYPNMLVGFAGGFVGVQLSPVHLCFSLTQKYYGAKMAPVYRMMAIPVVVVCLVAVAFAYGSRILSVL